MRPRPVIPLPQAVLGLTIFASIALPLTRAGLSLLDILLRMLVDSPMGALVFLIMFASPQLFGLGVALGGLLRSRTAVDICVQAPVIVMQGMTFLAGISMISSPRTVAPLAFAGFAGVTSVYYLYASAEANASERGPLSLRWHLRWGALLIAGFGLWLRLQSLRGPGLGIAVDVATGAAVLLLASLARNPVLPTATRSHAA